MTEKPARKRRKVQAAEIQQSPIDAEFLSGIRAALNPQPAEVANKPCPGCKKGLTDKGWCFKCKGTGKVRA